jgi:Zinc carboxypeptidase
MKSIYLFLFVFIINGPAQNQVYAKPNYTPTYAECIKFYEQLFAKYKQGHLHAFGTTDAGQPLHVFTISDKPYTHISELKNKTIILINNGIHPGEPDGINASMMLCEELLMNFPKYASLFKNVVLAFVPVYNIEGMLNRSASSRANQDGPAEYGFRGNGKNLDLNRDFIKMDSRNAWALVEAFQAFQPHVFVDTHVSNGSDYPYTFTYFFSHKDLLLEPLKNSLQILETGLNSEMKLKGHTIFPYVNSLEDIPDSGIAGFYDSPRYSSGYAAIHNTIGLVIETHMLKPFDERVKATYDGLMSVFKSTADNATKIFEARQAAKNLAKSKKQFDLSFEMDSTTFQTLSFKKFNAIYKKSEVTGLQRLYYDRSAPSTINVKFFDRLKSNLNIAKPKYYIVSQAWDAVIEKLNYNKIKYKILKNDSAINVSAYYLEDFKTTPQPYENHYSHRNLKLRTEKQNLQFFKGDVLIPCNTENDYFILSVLEPQSIDSYFTWNEFDAVLQQKEWFSDYVFEERAKELLQKDPQLKSDFEKKKAEDAKFSNNAFEQLYFIYKRSPYYEKSHRRYPVFRIE